MDTYVIMDYKEKYMEALERAKTLYENANGMILKKWVEQVFPELKESEDEKIRKCICLCLEECVHNDIIRDYEKDKCLAWLEKQGEQKPADKVEPKFKVGDWIITEDKNVHEDYRICRICKIENGRYYIENGDFFYKASFDNYEYRLWTIQDAKDGDVLACNEEILLFKSYSVQGRISLYCWYNGQTNNFHSKGVDDTLLTTRNKIYPATKEQRDALMKAMADAGYTFDFEKKELKKIEDKIEIPFGAKDSELQKASYHIPKGFYAEIDGNKVVIKKGNQKPAWSDKDEKNLQGIIDEIEANKNDAPDYDLATYDRFLDWLKSLKDRVQPKQEWSKEDEEMLVSIISDFAAAHKSSIGQDKWLKSLKERILPQPKQEWGEEDEKRVHRISDFIWKNRKGDTDEIYQQEQDVNWLKSIKDRVQPQNRWKPSEEMLEALYRATPENVMEKSEDEMLLDKLYQGLKYGKVLSKK